MFLLKFLIFAIVFCDQICTENCKIDLGNCYDSCGADSYCRYLCAADFNRCEDDCPERTCADYCCEHQGSGVPG